MAADEALVPVCDPASGRQFGVAFPVDSDGTLLTSHQAVHGREQLLLRLPGGATRVVAEEAVEPLAGCAMALLRTGEPLGGVPPLPLGTGRRTRLVALPTPAEGRTVRQLQGGVAGAVCAEYLGRLIEGAWVLEFGQAVPEGCSGTPVVDAETGAVVAVAVGGAEVVGGRLLAVPLGAALGEPALAEVVERNAVSVPAYGRALNLAGVLELAQAQLSAAVAGPGSVAEAAALRRPRTGGLLETYPGWPSGAVASAVVGVPGSGRSTELAALVAARTRGPLRLPTLWLRGADLRAGDDSLADAVDRALRRGADLLRTGTATPGAGAVCRLAAAAGRPLLVVLDGPEEMPPGLAPVLDRWTRGTADWLRRAEARLLIGCRPEYWERAGQAFRPEELYAPGVWLGGATDGPHPILDRLMGELSCAVPGLTARAVDPPAGELFEAFVDLLCLRVAQRLGPDRRLSPPARGTHRRGAPPAPAPPWSARSRAQRTRRLAVAVAGRVHEAARRMLGPGQGGLSRADFAGVFQEGEGGWAEAVLAERLFVPAGEGYRFADEAVGEWLQSAHLDLGAAFDALLGDAAGRASQRPGVPRHRCGVVGWALLRLGQRDGAEALDPWLARLAQGLEGAEEARWWAGRLLADTLLRVPDPGAHTALLRALAERLSRGGGEPPEALAAEAFWARLRLPAAQRVELLRAGVKAGWPGAREAVRRLVVEEPSAGLRVLCGWLRGEEAEFAEEVLLDTRQVGLDELVEGLVEEAHPRADALLGRLAEVEPSALCRAVDRWAHDPRSERHVAAVVHARRAARAVRGQGAERALLRYAAEAVLRRDGEASLHGAALAVLMWDDEARLRHLGAAVRRYRDRDPFLPAQALAPALDTCPHQVLGAFADGLERPGGAEEVLSVLGGTLAPHAQEAADRLIAGHLAEHPEAAAPVAAYLDARLRLGPVARGALLPFVRRILRAPGTGPEVRRSLVPVLSGAEPPLRQELLDQLLAVEEDPENLELVLDRVAAAEGQLPARVRQIVRTVRPKLAPGRLDLRLIRCARGLPRFAALLGEWLAEEPDAAPGPRTRRMRELLAEGTPAQRAAALAEQAWIRS